MGTTSRRSKCVLQDTKRCVFQCLVIMIGFNTCSSYNTQLGTNKLFLEARLDVRGLPTRPLFRLMLDPSPVQTKMMEEFRNLTSLQTVKVNRISPRYRQISLNFTLEFTQTVNTEIRQAVARTVLAMEKKGNITLQGMTMPFAFLIGIFDRPLGKLDDMQNAEDAIDWCSVGSSPLVSCREGGVCNDTGLRYTCPCEEGLDDNGTLCFARMEPMFNITMDNPTDIDLSDTKSARYNETKTAIEQQIFAHLQTKIYGLKQVVVDSLRSGSIIASCRLVLNTTGERPDIAFNLMNLDGQSIKLEGQDIRIVLQFPTDGSGQGNLCDFHISLWEPHCEDKICEIHEDDPENPTCVCLPGFQEKSSVNDTCVDIDECETNCNCCDQGCTNTIGSFNCSCNPGYVLDSDGRTCNDQDECSDNSDSCDQTCSNTDGSYTCECNTGYTLSSDGRTCNDQDECSDNSHSCDQTCSNTDGSYTCECNTGYTLSSNGRTCTDKNECSDNSHSCDQTCSNTDGSYTCACNPGYVLSGNGRTCTDINECSSNADGCGQRCINTVGSYYCTCLARHVLNSDGRTCRAVTCGTTHAAPSGVIETPGYSSEYWHTANPYDCDEKTFPNCNWRGSYRFNSNYIVCISECIWTITTAPGTAIKLTVEDIDTDDYDCCTDHIEIRNGIHSQSERLATLCGTAEPKPFISTGNNLYIRLDSSVKKRNGRIGNRFRASWETVCPDQIKTEEEGFIRSPGYPNAYAPSLDCVYVIDLPIGYSVILTKEWFRLDGNVGDYLEVNGLRFSGGTFPSSLSSGLGAVLVRFHSDGSQSSSRAGFSIRFRRREDTGSITVNFCESWYEKNRVLANAYSAGFSRLPNCPCYGGSNMGAYGFVKYNDENCFHLSQMRGKLVQPFGKRCCYINGNGALDRATNLAYNPSLPKYTTKYKQEELRAYRECCLSGSCASYERARPNLKGFCLDPNEIGIKVPIIDATLWGEPHIITLDKAEYTFNGWGEYTLLQVASDDLNFTLQGRTAPFQIGPDRYVNATVFTAFGSRQGAATVFVELDQDTKTSLVVYGNDRDLTLPFRDDPQFTWDTDDYLLQKQNDSLYAAFPSGIGIRVSVRMKTLAISVAMPLTFSNQTQGLLGNFNGNKTDDFVLPNGTVLSSSMTEREIFHKFGKAWAVTEESTVMRYGPREGPADYAHPEFLPVFLDEQPADVIQAAEQQCGTNNLACIYDYVATGNRDLALDSKTVKEEADEIAVLERNNAPTVKAPSTLRVTPNVLTYFTVSGYDYDNETVTYHAEDDANGQLQINPATGNVTFKLTAEDPPRMSFYTLDPKGVRSVSKDILLLICDCGTNGQCSFPNVTTEASEHNYFQNVGCICETGWDGAKCDQDRDGCKDTPCLPGQNCTDLSPSEEQMRSVGYDCGPCPQGYTAGSSGSTDCMDIDECASLTNQCSMLCNNTAGSYRCGCSTGYQLNNDGKSCLDVNECAEKLDGCPQKCRNTVGGFECACEDGYSYNQANNSCTANQATADLCRNAGCSQGCKSATDGSMAPLCFCLSGYDIDSTNASNCVDRDECQSNLCSQRCSNNEGSFACSCHSGYQLNQDQRTCTRCPDQRYGVQCSQTCTCSGRGLGCNHVTGCVCPGGWTGEHCEQDVDECTESPEICGANKECVNTEGSYTCGCPSGYILDNAEECQDFDECAESYDTCGPLENCVNVPGKFNCACKTGYHREGDSCVDIDECLSPWSNKCQQECVNVPGSFNCRCSYRYKLASDRFACVAETDTCILRSGSSLSCEYGCGIADDDSVFCLKPSAGFYFNETAQRFTDIDECKNASSCSHVCTNTEGSFNCSCPVGMFLDNDRITCLACASGTYGKDCTKQCNCGRGSARCDAVTGCVCLNGWTGNNCDVDTDECNDVSLQLQCQGNASCINTPGSYRCQCHSGYRKDNSGSCNDIDECESSPCDQECENNAGNYRCLCSRGFSRDDTTGMCEDIDECESSPCDQECENNAGNYRCLCSRGFSLDDTTGMCEDIDECASDELNNCSQQCLNNPGSYMCGCDLPGDQLADDGVSCVGPCSNYRVLDDAYRDVNRGNTWKCDSGLTKGWYRFFLNREDAVMPTKCVKSNRCGTRAAYWLDLQGRELPAVGQETVARVCGSLNGNCCHAPRKSAVRNCGAFYLYELTPSPWCTAGYCAKKKDD